MCLLSITIWSIGRHPSGLVNVKILNLVLHTTMLCAAVKSISLIPLEGSKSMFGPLNVPSVNNNIELVGCWSIGRHSSGLMNVKMLKLGATYYHAMRGKRLSYPLWLQLLNVQLSQCTNAQSKLGCDKLVFRVDVWTSKCAFCQ